MKIILNIFRNALGGLIAFIIFLIPVKKIKRSVGQQQKVDNECRNLELYQFFACPFCIKTRRAIRRLNLKIVTRSAQGKNIYREELLKEVGKVQVPCLKINENDKSIWILESSEIISYLEKRFT